MILNTSTKLAHTIENTDRREKVEKRSWGSWNVHKAHSLGELHQPAHQLCVLHIMFIQIHRKISIKIVIDSLISLNKIL